MDLRIIPARAGFTAHDPGALAHGEDHPRSRGVYTAAGLPHVRLHGSSPLARGLLSKPTGYWAWRRIIPARAGFTGPETVGGYDEEDHPRSRGVYDLEWWTADWARGSSPLARGLRDE